MVDTFTKSQRSDIMRRVHGKDTSPEIALRRALWARGVRGYRLHVKSLPGSPDLAFRRRRTAVFIDGCFWHGCPKCYRRPSSNTRYWDRKVERNIERDRRQRRQLRRAGWKVIRVWEHQLKPANLRRTARRLAARLGAPDPLTR